METKFNFKSAICTNREQSERLLALGLKKETADMGWVKLLEGDGYVMAIAEDYSFIDIPAWSLNRIRELLKKSQVTLSFFEDGDYVVVERYGVFQNILDQRVDMWDNLCDAFQYLITEGYFNKDYLIN